MLRASQGHRLRTRRKRDCAQHLPARAGEAEVRNKPVTGREQASIEAKHGENQLGQSLTAGCM